MSASRAPGALSSRSVATASGDAPDPVLLRHSQVFMAISDAVLVTDLSGRVIDCNPAAERLTGYRRDRLLGVPASAQYDSAKAEALLSRILAAVRADETWTGDLPLLRFDGSRRVIELTASGLYDTDGALVAIAGISRDVTTDRQRAAELGRAEQRWRLTLDGAPTGIALIGLDGRFERVNPTLCRILGRSETQLLALSFQDITHPGDLDADLDLLAQLVTGQIDSYTLDKRYLHADGHPVWIALSVGLVIDPATGDPLHYVSQMHDVSVQRAATERQAAIIDSAGDPFVGVDAAGCVTEWNAAAERTFGWSASDVCGRALHGLLFPAEPREQHLADLSLLAVAPDRNGTVRPSLLMAQCASGRRLPVEVSAWKAAGGADEYYAFVRDVSARTRAEHHRRATAARQSALVDAHLAIADVELTPSKVMSLICEHAARLTGARGAVIELRDGEDMVCSVATSWMEPHIGLRVPVQASMSGRVALAGEAMICTDTDTDPRVDAAACRKVEVRSMVVVPLRRVGAVLGVLIVMSSRPSRFTEADRATLELLAAPFGAALANAHALDTSTRQALTDPLTGLANRTRALHELDRALARQARHGGHVAVVFADLDGFKAVNDTVGHAAGDQLLNAVADRIRAAVRTTDTPARHGGDEFVIICEALAEPPDIEQVAARLIHSLKGTYQLDEGAASVGVSVGVAVATSVVPPQALLAAADEAMYEAKRAGGNGHRIRYLPTPS